jgi:hypothetical protein
MAIHPTLGIVICFAMPYQNNIHATVPCAAGVSACALSLSDKRRI